MSSKQAQLDKEKGNTAFKAGDYATAVGHYSSAIVNDRKDYTLPLNRAAAYLKLGKHDDAERDCTTVLSLSASNAKALFRRSQARVGTGKLKEAEDDLRAAAKLEPSNTSIAQELTKVTDASKRKTVSKARPIDVAPNSKPMRRRIPITIVDDTVDKPPSASVTSSKPANIEPAARPAPIKRVDIHPRQAPKEEHASSTPQATFKEAKRSQDDVKTSRVGGGIFRSNGSNTIFPTRDVTIPKSNNTKTVPSHSMEHDPPASIPLEAPSIPAPKSLYDLTKAWDMHRSSKERFQIITSVPPAQLQALFKTSLEPSLLASILETLLNASNENSTVVVEYLEALSKVPRLGTIILFLSEGERTVLRRLVEKVGVDKVNVIWRKV
ncbi:TPR-like protein [Armillaria mellea]|nr:TPR-like protein [Armillaria mellea]